MLRPIDVIFKHPVKKFTVIYQNGKLWQLPRLDFDGQSLAYKTPYKGSREQIFVAQNQILPNDDLVLCSQLATLDLPATVVGRNVDQFEQWWRQNSFEYKALSDLAKQNQEMAKQQLANPSTHLAVSSPATTAAATMAATTTVATTPSLSVKTPLPPVPQSSVPPPSQHPSPPMPKSVPTSISSANNSDDIFDQMFSDLTKP